ncbi:cbb3-type cytochrome c oxidase subunit II [Ferruginibacter sp.]|nr:c-type cytochrome [Ferruginibacter sp.]
MIKKYGFSLIALFAIILLSFCLPVNKKQQQQQAFFADTLPTALELYGSYVYQREACSNCHSLLYDSTNNHLISLDGLSNKRFSDSWHYRHIMDPAAMTIDSRMPAFPALFVKKIKNDKLLQLYLQQNNNHRSSDSAILYKKLQQQAATIAQNLQKDGIPNYNLQQKEIVALIAYLQQIPSGPQRRYKDSLWTAAIKNQMAAWDNTPLNDSSTVMRLANSNNKDTIAMGTNLFTTRICFACHGRQGEGGVGPNLTDGYWLHGSSSKQIMLLIANGIPDRGMQAFKSQLTPEEIGQLTAYIRSLKNSNPPNAKLPQGEKE